MQAILVADYSFTPLEYWRGVSLPARAFIKRCLTIDPTKRMTSHEALTHEWIAGPAHGRGKEDLLPTVKKNFNARRTLHKAIDTVRAINQLRAGGGMGMMDGAQSHAPDRVTNGTNGKATRDGDGDVNMGGGTDSRGHGRGQTDAQIRDQENKIKGATEGLWGGQAVAGTSR